MHQASAQSIDEAIASLEHARKGDLLLYRKEYVPGSFAGTMALAMPYGKRIRDHVLRGNNAFYAMGYLDHKVVSGKLVRINGIDRSCLRYAGTRPVLADAPCFNPETGAILPNIILFSRRSYGKNDRLYVGDEAFAKLEEMGIPEFEVPLRGFARRQRQSIN